jgi:hypothetical protein
LPELDELEALEPHAAIAVAAAITAATARRFEANLNMPQLVTGDP